MPLANNVRDALIMELTNVGQRANNVGGDDGHMKSALRKVNDALTAASRGGPMRACRGHISLAHSALTNKLTFSRPEDVATLYEVVLLRRKLYALSRRRWYVRVGLTVVVRNGASAVRRSFSSPTR